MGLRKTVHLMQIICEILLQNEGYILLVFFFGLVKDNLIYLGTCGCRPITLNLTAGSFLSFLYFRYSHFVFWKEPENFTCSHKYINERIDKLYGFKFVGIGQYKILYKYVLYGGKSHTCYVVVNVNKAQRDRGTYKGNSF